MAEQSPIIMRLNTIDNAIESYIRPLIQRGQYIEACRYLLMKGCSRRKIISYIQPFILSQEKCNTTDILALANDSYEAAASTIPDPRLAVYGKFQRLRHDVMHVTCQTSASITQARIS